VGGEGRRRERGGRRGGEMGTERLGWGAGGGERG